MLGLRSKKREAEQAGPTIQADFTGATIYGQVAVGAHIHQDSEQGAIVTEAAPGEQPVPKLRDLPRQELPRDFPHLLGRQREVADLEAALETGEPVELCGEPGIGKTALLRNFFRHSYDCDARDGVLYTVGRRKPLEDLLKLLFDSFYECGAVVVPTEPDLAQYLGERRALVVIDDAELDRDELGHLMDTAPGCQFLVTSSKRCLWGEGSSLRLEGLDEDAALELMERELGRPLTGEEASAAKTLLHSVHGSPLRLIQGAALLSENGATAEGLTEAERAALAPLAALPGVPLGVDHVAAITGADSAADALESLEERGLAQSHSPRYSLAGAAGGTFPVGGDAELLRERALRHFAAWVAGEKRGSARPLDDLEAIHALLEWGVESERWEDVLALARGIEASLSLSGRFGAWLIVLEQALRAARALGDTEAEAWALHQLGSRALLLEDRATAGSQLTEALAKREALGEWEGAMVTRHNLGLLAGSSPAPGRVVRWTSPLAVLLALVLLAGAGVTALNDSGEDHERNAREPAAAPNVSPPSEAREQPAPGDDDRRDRSDGNGPPSVSQSSERPGPPAGAAPAPAPQAQPIRQFNSTVTGYTDQGPITLATVQSAPAGTLGAEPSRCERRGTAAARRSARSRGRSGGCWGASGQRAAAGNELAFTGLDLLVLGLAGGGSLGLGLALQRLGNARKEEA